MFAVASNLFSKPSYLSAYTIHTQQQQLSSGSNSAGPSTPQPPSSNTNDKPFNVGLWKVLPASHKTTLKDVSVWIFEKKVLDSVKPSAGAGGSGGREWVVEQLKKEASSLSRLRHPDILHVVEPLDESRSELTFITERITSSLQTLLNAVSPSSSRQGGRPPGADYAAAGQVDLDETEIQKGTLQLSRGLGFLHTQAKMVHLNLSPEAVLINSKGDWKLSGLALTTPLTQPDGSATKYVYPEVDTRLPPQVQWKLDYLAPEYALDSTLTPSSDLYSLGCILYAVHMGGKPPFVNRGSMQSLREHAEGSLTRREWMHGPRWERCSQELKDLLPRLLTRNPSNRISLASLPSHPFFSSLAISTLNFLDPTTFASKPREEKATFLRGLVRVLPTFSERLRKGKVLPSLLDEMKDPYLLPFLLPNVFEISKGLDEDEFAAVLIKLQPLFVLKDPPQNMLTLLEHLSLFEEKTNPPTFRENVMPLIYNSLESEHLPVQERVLKTVPHLCEILDYGTVQNVLLVKVAILFTRTRILSVKVQTLECFTAMVKTLDKATLTTKLVPLLAKIKTKEPAVMMATLAVHEAMGAKVDREAIATLVLPQLWAMSMGPLLNAQQFSKFMTVVKTLGARVETEHSAHLRDVHRIEAQTASLAAANNFYINGMSTSANGTSTAGGEVDFESLVRGGAGQMPDFENVLGAAATISATTTTVNTVTDPWEDEWANGGDEELSSTFPSLSVNSTGNSAFPSFPSTATSPKPTIARNNTNTSMNSAGSSKLKARPVPASTFNSAVFNSHPNAIPTLAPPTSFSSSPIQSRPQAQAQAQVPSQYTSLQPLAPAPRTVSSSQPRPTATIGGGAPNYNLSLSQQVPLTMTSIPTSTTSSNALSFMSSQQPIQPQPQYPQQQQTMQSQPQPAAVQVQAQQRPPPGWSTGLMQPTAAPKPVWGKSHTAGNGGNDWGDFDPLK